MLELYYWPGLPGRGELVRLLLEVAEIEYRDVGRDEGVEAVVAARTGSLGGAPGYAPPYVRVDGRVMNQVANILQYLGEKHDLAGGDAHSRVLANQLQLTLADFLTEAHDTHHRLSIALAYENQRDVCMRGAPYFLDERLPAFLGFFERVLAENPAGSDWLVGNRLTYPDLTLFHIVSGLHYAFPRAMAALRDDHPLCHALHDRIAALPAIEAYRASERWIGFNETGIFRHYPELDRID